MQSELKAIADRAKWLADNYQVVSQSFHDAARRVRADISLMHRKTPAEAPEAEQNWIASEQRLASATAAAESCWRDIKALAADLRVHLDLAGLALVYRLEPWHESDGFDWMQGTAELKRIEAAAVDLHTRGLTKPETSISQKQFAEISGLSKGRVSQLASEGEPITIEAAQRRADSNIENKNQQNAKRRKEAARSEPPAPALASAAAMWKCGKPGCNYIGKHLLEGCPRCGGDLSIQPPRKPIKRV